MEMPEPARLTRWQLPAQQIQLSLLWTLPQQVWQFASEARPVWRARVLRRIVLFVAITRLATSFLGKEASQREIRFHAALRSEDAAKADVLQFLWAAVAANVIPP